MAIAWADSNYTKRRVILLDPPTANLTNKDYLLKLKDGTAIANADMASKRYLVTDWLGNVLSYEQEAYSEGSHPNPAYVNFETWAKLPNTYASPSGDQNSVCVYYAHDGGGDLDDAANVWDANFAAVWHLTDLLDSSGNGHTMSAYNTPTSGATGMVGDCYSFASGSNEYLERAAAVISATPFTWEVWGKPSNVTSFFWALAIADQTYSNRYYGLAFAGNIAGDPIRAAAVQTSEAKAETPISYSAGVWHYAIHRSSADNSREAILNADFANKATNTTSKTVTGESHTAIGASADSTRAGYFDGPIDEVRISSIARSDAWLGATYHNINDADNAQTWGAEETAAELAFFPYYVRRHDSLMGRKHNSLTGR